MGLVGLAGGGVGLAGGGLDLPGTGLVLPGEGFDIPAQTPQLLGYVCPLEPVIHCCAMTTSEAQPMPAAKKLIEVALPLDAINRASAREKSIRHGHPSTLHLWWARRPLAAARAVIFASLVDDPADPHANPAFVAACQALPGAGQNVIEKGDTPRMRLFDFIERLVKWESTSDETIMSQARRLIRIATDGKPPPLLDPFAGGGSIPLEAQRLGLEAHASDLNPVAVMINKAMI